MSSKFSLYTNYYNGAFFKKKKLFAVLFPSPLLCNFVSEFEKVQSACH